MAKLASLFRRPVFLLGLGILLLLYVLWTLSGSWQLESAQRWNLIFVVGGTLYTGLLIYGVREYLSERRLKKDMTDQARRQNAQAGPEAQRDFAVLEKDFNQAFEELADLCREQGLLRGEGATKLPWIVVIGPPGTGKTTALEQSGLRFTALGRRLQGIGGTRNCTWWLAQEAVILDTAGRFATHEESRDEWLAFLGLLRKRRRKNPIDSAIVQIGVEELLPLSRRDQEEMALQLRERLDELSRHLGVNFPVHVVFAKADLIDGFSEFFALLPAAEKAQPFGFPLDLEALRGKEVAAVFGERFERLCDGLLARATRYMYGAGVRDAQEAVLYFPAELRRHREALAQFTQTLCEPNRRGEQPILSGVYFSSALQQGGAMPGMRVGLGGDMGLRGPAPARRPMPAPRAESVPFFLPGLFSRVLLQAQNSARPNQARQAAMRRQLGLWAGVGALFCLGGGWALVHGYRADERWLEDVKSATRELRSSGRVHTTQPTLRDLGEELQLEVELNELLRKRPLDGELGDAYRVADQLLYKRIDEQILYPLHGVMETHLSNAARWEQDGPGDVFGNGYRALQSDLILRRGNCPETTPQERLQIIVDYVDNLWWQELGEKTRTPDSEPVRENLRRVLTLFFKRYLRASGSSGAPPETTALLVEGGHQKEAQDRLRDSSSKLTPPLIFNLVASGSGLYKTDNQLRGEIFADRPIAAVFTQSGCKTFFDKDSSKGKVWWSCVLGVKADRKLDIGQAEDDYFVEQYQRAWREWLSGIQLKKEIKPRKSKETEVLEEVSKVFTSLSRTEDSELEQLFKVIGEGQDERNHAPINWPGENEGWFGGCMAKLRGGAKGVTTTLSTYVASACGRAKKPFGIYAGATSGEKDKQTEPQELYRGYVKAVRLLAKQLEHLRRSTDGAAEALPLVLNTMKDSGELVAVAAARRELMYSLQQTASPVDPAGLAATLERLDWSAWASLVAMSVEALNDQWNSAIYSKWKDLHKQAKADPAFCPKIIDFVKGDLESHAQKNILPFFKEGTCEPKVPAEPFNRPLMNFTPGFCQQLANVRALAQTKCPEGAAGAAPAPDPPRVPVAADYKTSGQSGCQNKAVQTVRLDTGAAVYDCNTSVKTCLPLASPETSHQANLRVKFTDSPMITIFPSFPSLDEMIDNVAARREGDNRLRFSIPAAKVAGGCAGIEVTVDFRPQPRKNTPRGPAEDTRWKTLDLPQKVASAPKIESGPRDGAPKSEPRKGTP